MSIEHGCIFDARDLTDYRQSSDVNNEIIKNNKLNNIFEFNKFIKDNGVNFMEKNLKEKEDKYNCGNYYKTLEEKYIQNCDDTNCYLLDNNEDGLGVGRYMKYNSTDNK
tara:strand:+ start:861 stop:1187 length:327 start_codon:yes stop_codon:yes gene_type:complete